MEETVAPDDPGVIDWGPPPSPATATFTGFPVAMQSIGLCEGLKRVLQGLCEGIASFRPVTMARNRKVELVLLGLSTLLVASRS